MNAVFVTGTDTGVGKTVVTGLLARYLLGKGYNAVTQKWIETGAKGFSRDIRRHLKIMGKKESDIKDYLDAISPYVFKFASSPHLAAALVKKAIDPQKIKKSFRLLGKKFDYIIVEGTGGALVPYNKKKLVIDIARELKLPVIIVVGNRLGAINQTLLTVEAIKRRGMKILGLVFNNTSKSGNKKILSDNIRIIKKLTGVRVIASLPYSNKHVCTWHKAMR